MTPLRLSPEFGTEFLPVRKCSSVYRTLLPSLKTMMGPAGVAWAAKSWRDLMELATVAVHLHPALSETHMSCLFAGLYVRSYVEFLYLRGTVIGGGAWAMTGAAIAAISATIASALLNITSS